MRRALCLSILLLATLPAPAVEKPLMRDFMGLNVHTVNFKPDLYAPVTKVLQSSAAVDDTMSEVAMRGGVDSPSFGTTASAMEPHGRAILHPD